MLSVSDVRESAAGLMFGSPLINNVYRGVVAEALVAAALRDTAWRHCAGDWNGWDFEHGKCRLEVKQSAAVQSWPQRVPTRSSFSIAASQGYWSEFTYIPDPRRKAAIYVFAYHWVQDRAVADHREPEQWQFFVVSADALPEFGKSIALSKLQRLAVACDISQLAAEIEGHHERWRRAQSLR